MARKKELEPAARPPSVFDSGDFPMRKCVQNAQGFWVPVAEPDEARDVLKRMIADKTQSDDYRYFSGIVEGIQNMPDDVCDMVCNWIVQQIGVDVIAEVQAELGAPKIAPPTREQLAKEKAESITTAFHIACGQFKKKNGEPRRTLVARRLFELGFFFGDIADVSGYSRGLLADARQWNRAICIREGRELGPNLRLDPRRGAKRTGDDLRGGSGALFEENKAASRLVASVADVLAPVQPKKKRRAYRNEVEGVAPEALIGSYDLGSDYSDAPEDVEGGEE